MGLQDGRVHDKSDKIERKYQLRYAAGLYWLLDMQQSGDSYIHPVPLNEGGAQLWKLFERGMSEAEVCRWLSEAYDLPPEQAQKDVRGFIAQLKNQKVDFGGTE